MIEFENNSKLQAETTEIKSLTDVRLVKIDPQADGFFDKVINFKSTDDRIKAFIETVAKVKYAKLQPYYRPIYDPSEEGDKIVYKKGNKPALRHSYNWWVQTASRMPLVEGRHWQIATEYQYYAFLVWLINQLVDDGKSVRDALTVVVLDSKNLGYYFDSEHSKVNTEYHERTGSRCVCGVYDLANAYKILRCSKEAEGLWLGSGNFIDRGHKRPLANLKYFADGDNIIVVEFSVGLLVL
jgi:hypothetical protein